jgi:hypothetical protein
MTQNRFSEAGRRSGALAAAKAAAVYNAAPNICLWCGKPIPLRKGQRPSTARTKKYCDIKCKGAALGQRFHVNRGLKPGQKFARLTVVEEIYRSSQKLYVYKCRCDCGGETVARGDF